jgi:hypothetical protein
MRNFVHSRSKREFGTTDLIGLECRFRNAIMPGKIASRQETMKISCAP